MFPGAGTTRHSEINYPALAQRGNAKQKQMFVRALGGRVLATADASPGHLEPAAAIGLRSAAAHSPPRIGSFLFASYARGPAKQKQKHVKRAQPGLTQSLLHKMTKK